MNQVVLTGFADEISDDATEQIITLQKTGLSHLELRGVGGENVLDLSPAAVTAFKQQLDDAGLGVSAIGSPIGKVQARSDLEAHFDRFRIAVERAHQFSAGYVRIFSFYHEGEEADQVRDLVLAQMYRMVDHAETEGVVLLHENEKGIYGDLPERCVDLLQSVDNPHLRAAFDGANFLQSGADSRRDAWPALKRYVDYFHIKDVETQSGRVVPAGRGDTGLEAILRDALAQGFRGFLSVEPHLKAGDADFGGTGAQRFETAVEALRQVLQRLGAEVVQPGQAISRKTK